MATVTRSVVITDPVCIHTRPASLFVQAVAGSGCAVTIAKEGGAPVPATILSVMGLGIKQGDTVVLTVDGENADAVADSLVETLTKAE